MKETVCDMSLNGNWVWIQIGNSLYRNIPKFVVFSKPGFVMLQPGVLVSVGLINRVRFRGIEPGGLSKSWSSDLTLLLIYAGSDNSMSPTVKFCPITLTVWESSDFLRCGVCVCVGAKPYFGWCCVLVALINLSLLPLFGGLFLWNQSKTHTHTHTHKTMTTYQ